MDKPRKRIAGAIRDKERTMLKLIAAVGEIIKNEGYTALGVNNIAKKAEVNKKLIYRYFDNNVNNLIETYVKTKDYWIGLSGDMEKLIAESQIDGGRPMVKTILKTHLSFFYTEEEMQKIVIWETSEKNKLMKEVGLKREAFGEEVFKMLLPHFEDSGVDFRAIMALQIAGIIFMVLQSKASGNPFCGIDINNPKDMDRILNSLDQLTDLVYDKARS
ncbi:TetR family transcriptional regulator [Pedobacter ginsengisoli]|uniref:TetR family transcriptional regulator n=1 Tax=Pedobacter ginsengisoli TaxID=363852 RepID=A0A2D1U0F7_9SPHI|nr:TetR/AcrR family transcriptional regulator [Pedobacter ginsengisoli]ATP55093.1 TetR family transcriptional regulator [Pedobacter ginsengisoli]